MAAARTEYLLPDGIDAGAVHERMAEHLRLASGPVRSVDQVFYDTFDGRLDASRLQLVRNGARLQLFETATDEERASAELPRGPRRIMASELPTGRLRDLVAPVVEMRALLEIARIHRRRRELRVLDGEEKTVVRLVLEEPSLVGPGRTRTGLGSRMHAPALRGYDAELVRVQETLEGELGFRPVERPLLEEAVEASGGAPAPTELGLGLHPELRADAAVTMLLTRLAAEIRRNLPGAIAD